MIRRMLLACCCAFLTAAAPSVANSHAPITLVINGDRVAVAPSITIVGSTIFVPLRKILDIFGLPFDLHGKNVTTQVGSSVVTVTIGSDIARVDDRIVRLNSPVREIGGAAYVPLRFITDVLGAQATYDSKLRAVNVSADRIGITGSGLVRRDGRLVATGTVSAIDLLTDPPTVTLVNNGVAHTFPMSSDVTVTAQDVVLNVRTPGELASIHPGDFARIALGRDGLAQYVTDAFGSRAGRIIAIGSGLMLLDDGEMIRPVRGTTISLNGNVVGIDALHPGDQVVVRYNVESGETREILASRSIGEVPQSNSTVKILSVSTDAQRPLRAGEILRVTMQGTPGGQAWFDIGPFVQHVPLVESGSGTYSGTYTIKAGSNFTDVPIIAHLQRASGDTATAEASDHLSAATSPPAISSFGPRDGANVTSRRPAIFATFATSAVAVSPSSVMLRINGHDVTASCIRTHRFISYLPSVNYPLGVVTVEVRATDFAGNATDFTWHFRITRG